MKPTCRVYKASIKPISNVNINGYEDVWKGVCGLELKIAANRMIPNPRSLFPAFFAYPNNKGSKNKIKCGFECLSQ